MQDTSILIAAIAYAAIGVVWGRYAMYKQEHMHPLSRPWKVTMVGIVNLFIWPFAIIVALFNRELP